MGQIQAMFTTLSDKIQLNNSRQGQGVVYVKFPVSNGWRVLAFDAAFDAVQTYFPNPLQPYIVSLEAVVGYGAVVPATDGRNSYQFINHQSTSVGWNVFDWDQRKGGYIQMDVATSDEVKPDYMIAQLNYSIPVASVSSDSCTFNVQFGLLIGNEDPNAPLPVLEVVHFDDHPYVAPQIDYLPWILIGGFVLIGGFLALELGKEYRAERATGGSLLASARSLLGSTRSKLRL